MSSQAAVVDGQAGVGESGYTITIRYLNHAPARKIGIFSMVRPQLGRGW